MWYKSLLLSSTVFLIKMPLKVRFDVVCASVVNTVNFTAASDMLPQYSIVEVAVDVVTIKVS